MTSFILEVDELDIKYGLPDNQFSCPYALALNRRLESYETSVADSKEPYAYAYTEDGDYVTLGLSKRSLSRILLFDRTGVMEPHRARIEILHDPRVD